ncbi:MAG: acyl carrier protein [Parvibaculum sedimenti]|uniref:acyl carrier protein n=1 Tax=Parvibaculum sedimenti TaxID=2608632 RepID=UPI003BB64D75
MSDARVKEIIAECTTGCPIAPEEMKASTALAEDLGVDSLDIIEISMAIEEEFDISVSDEIVEEFKTVGDVTKYVALREAEKA